MTSGIVFMDIYMYNGKYLKMKLAFILYLLKLL